MLPFLHQRDMAVVLPDEIVDGFFAHDRIDLRPKDKCGSIPSSNWMLQNPTVIIFFPGRLLLYELPHVKERRYEERLLHLSFLKRKQREPAPMLFARMETFLQFP